MKKLSTIGIIALCLLNALLSGSAKAQSTIKYVTVNGAGTRDGSSWSNAKKGTQLRDVMANLPAFGEVWVAKGTYYPHDTDRSLSFQLKENRKLYGGFAGNETNVNARNVILNKTILSGDIGLTNVISDNSYRILEVQSDELYDTTVSSIIDGVTITMANNVSSDSFGGGLIIKNGINKPRFYNCNFTKNYAKVGGAFYDYITYINRSKFYNCVFEENSAQLGSVYAKAYSGNYNSILFDKCIFKNNTAEYNPDYNVDNRSMFYIISLLLGVNAEYRFKNCQITNNAIDSGCLFRTFNAGHVVFDSTTISNNTGHTFLNYFTKTHLTINGSTIDSNKSKYIFRLFSYESESNPGSTNSIRSPFTAYYNFRNSKFRFNDASINLFHISCGTSNLARNISVKDSTYITNCLFFNNAQNAVIHSEASNGGTANTIITNSTFYNDEYYMTYKGWNRQIYQQAAKGNGIDPYGNSRMEINNCIIYHTENLPAYESIRSEYSYYGTYPGVLELKVKNTLLHSSSGSWPALSGTDMGGNIINVNPRFMDTLGDFRLRGSSPARNAGDGSKYLAAFPAKDLGGNYRIDSNYIDIGAYEYTRLPVTMALDVDTTNLDINIIVKSNLPIDSVTWTLGDGTSGNTNPILHTYDSAGTYRVCIKIFSDCTSKDTCFNLTVKDIKSGIYHFEKMPFSVFPNPANDVININGLQKTYNLQLTNTLGQRFINRTSNKNHEVLDISSLSAGHYLLLVSDITEGTIYKVNIIKQQ